MRVIDCFFESYSFWVIKPYSRNLFISFSSLSIDSPDESEFTFSSFTEIFSFTSASGEELETKETESPERLPKGVPKVWFENWDNHSISTPLRLCSELKESRTIKSDANG